MKLKQRILPAIGFILLSTLAAQAMAKPPHPFEVVKVSASDSNDVNVLVKQGDDVKRYEFSKEELAESDNVAAKLGDLPEDTQQKVLDLLNQLNGNDSGVMELKLAQFGKGDKGSEVFVIKSQHDDKTRVEVEYEGEHLKRGEPFFIARSFEEGDGTERVLPHALKLKHGKDGKRKPLYDVLTHLIERADLDQEQIDKLIEQLNSKR